MEHGISEPIRELLAAAVVHRPRRLRRALPAVGWADEPNVEVKVVPPPRLHLAEPTAVGAGIAAQGFLDRRVHEDAGDLRVLRRGADHRQVRRRPHLRVDVQAILGDDHGRRHFFPLLPRQFAVGHLREPDVGVEADLMAGMAGEHRAAARLRHVAHEQPVPAGLRRLRGEPLEELHQVGMAPVAVAREPHHLPGRAVDRQRHGARETALGIEADGARLQIRRRGLAAEQLLGRRRGIVRLGERRQRLRIEGALVLRACDLRREQCGQHQCGGAPNGVAPSSALRRLYCRHACGIRLRVPPPPRRLRRFDPAASPAVRLPGKPRDSSRQAECGRDAAHLTPALGRKVKCYHHARALIRAATACARRR